MSGADIEAELREESEVLAGNVWRNAGRCGPDCGIASGLATRAADEIAALRAELAAARTVTPEMVEAALVKWYDDPDWDVGGPEDFVEHSRRDMRAALEAAMAMGVNDGR